MRRDDLLSHIRKAGGQVYSRVVNGVNKLAIQLRNTAVSDDDLKSLLVVRNEIDLVGLEGTRVSDAGLVYLVDLPNLENIDLTNVPLTDSGLEVLAQIPSLMFLHIEGTNVSKKAVEDFCRLRPECDVVWDE